MSTSPESRSVIECAYAPPETAWSATLPPELCPPRIVVYPGRWCPTVGYADVVYAGLSDEDKANPWRLAPLSARLTAAVRDGTAHVAKERRLFSYGGEPKRFEPTGKPHGGLLTVPYLWCLGPKLVSPGQVVSPAVAAFSGIQQFAGNSDLYAYFPHNNWPHKVIEGVAVEMESALTNAFIPHTVVRNCPDRVVIRVDNDWPLVFPLWRGRVRIDDGTGCTGQAITVSYQPSLPVAACEIRVQQMHPPANPTHELVVYEMVLVDTADRLISHAPKIFVNQFPTTDEAMRRDHRWGYVNWRQTHHASVFVGRHHLLTAYGDGVPFDAIPDALPDDPDLCYTTLWRMVAEGMHRAYGLPDAEARTLIIELARQIKPGTDRLMDVICEYGSVSPAKVQEGLMQIIRWTTTQPHGLALLTEALGLGRLFPRAQAVTGLVPLSDSEYSASVQMPTIAVDQSRYSIRSANAITDTVSSAVSERDDGTSPIDVFAYLWQPFA